MVSNINILLNNQQRLRSSRSSSQKKTKAINSARIEASINRCRSPKPLSLDEGTIIYKPSRSVVQSVRKVHDSPTSLSDAEKIATQRRDPTFLSPAPVQVSKNVNHEGRCAISESVSHFLSTCLPPLDHLSIHFAKYGCTTEAHLFRFATWEKKIRYERLKDMLKGVTAMDVLLLEEHLDAYLSLVQGKY